MPAPIVVGAEIATVYTSAQLGNIRFRTGHKYYDEQGRPHRFVKYNNGAGNNEGVAGLFVARMGGDALKGEVTCDLDDSEALVNLPGGQLRAALQDGNYGFLQTGGPNAVAATTDGNVALGSVCVLDSTGVGVIKPWASGLGKAAGVARDADASTALAIGDLIITCEENWE
jgi:hypothetical protein